MINIEYKKFHDRDFRMVIQKLAQVQMKSPIAFRIKEVVKKLQGADDIIKEDFKKEFGGKVFQLTSKGDYIPDQSNPIGLKLQDGVTFEDFHAQEESFNKRQVQIDANKLTSQTLMEAMDTWSAAELIALEPIYVEMRKVEQEGETNDAT